MDVLFYFSFKVFANAWKLTYDAILIKRLQITDISQHTPYQGFSVTGYIMNR
jgi:hypothetical protein